MLMPLRASLCSSSLKSSRCSSSSSSSLRGLCAIDQTRPAPSAPGLIDHLLELLIGHALAQLLRNALQVLERDLACLVVVEEAKRL